MLGRAFTKQDDSPDTAETVMLSYGYWKRKFGGDSSAIGAASSWTARAARSSAVLPQRFHFLDYDDPAVLVTFQLDRGKTAPWQLQL